MQHPLVLCGHGWLGSYLADTRAPATVISTTRTPEKCRQLARQGYQAIPFTLGDDPAVLTRHCAKATVLLNIPPGRRNPSLDSYLDNMLALIDAMIDVKVGHLIFISTTSVYGEETTHTVTETTPVDPQTVSAKAHVAIEERLRRYPNYRVSIVRLAGLVGPDRHPVNALSGKHFSAGNKVVNLVHVTDVVTALTQLIQRGGEGKTYHLCSLAHPKRGDYYPRTAHARGLALPRFDDTTALPVGKRIDARWSWEMLNTRPQYATPDDMI